MFTMVSKINDLKWRSALASNFTSRPFKWRYAIFKKAELDVFARKSWRVGAYPP